MDEYYDLGSYTRAVTTASNDAQRWFDRGLIWAYGYHHEEAVACFETALTFDENCSMAQWGIGYAIGPNYNRQWGDFDETERTELLDRAHDAIAAARETSNNGTSVEKALIEALSVRYPTDPTIEDFGPWNDAYADAMRRVHSEHAGDRDVVALFAEALMNRTPWQLWNLRTGKPADGADTAEAIDVLESAFEQLDDTSTHPGLLHMYIHLMEMSPHPERALQAGDHLYGLVPDAGHLQHMATHIDVLCGDYQNVVERNDAAIVADQKYLARSGPMNFYTVYRCHNYHFKIYGAMFLGQFQPAITAARDLADSITPDILEPLADWLEAFIAMDQHVLIRFGKWDEIKNQVPPEDADLYAMTTALLHYAKGVAYAATGDLDEAETERLRFLEAKERVPETRMLFNNTCVDILEIASAMLDGEIAYRRADYDVAFDHLRRSIELDDSLPYDEPWGWMQPTRHALGALLVEQGHLAEAEAVYRADLGFDRVLSRASHHPDNVWALHGLHECLMLRGAHEEAGLVKQRLDIANARADVPIEGSCFCRLQPA